MQMENINFIECIGGILPDIQQKMYVESPGLVHQPPPPPPPIMLRATCMHQQLFLVMAYCLFGIKPLGQQLNLCWLS